MGCDLAAHSTAARRDLDPGTALLVWLGLLGCWLPAWAAQACGLARADRVLCYRGIDAEDGPGAEREEGLAMAPASRAASGCLTKPAGEQHQGLECTRVLNVKLASSAQAASLSDYMRRQARAVPLPHSVSSVSGRAQTASVGASQMVRAARQCHSIMLYEVR